MVTKIYDITKNFPKEELYGITSQIRRAAVSIPSNISEGAARYHKEFVQFLYIALGSLSELETQIILSEKSNYISNTIYEKIQMDLSDLRKMLFGLINHLHKKI